MGFEFSEGKISKDDKRWLKGELRAIEGDISIEPDCQSVEYQLMRDMYYASQGSAIDLSLVEHVRLDTLDMHQVLSPIEDTQLGYLCQEVIESPTEEPEFVLICGAIFGANRLHKIKKVTSITGEYWPQQSDSFVCERFFEIDDPNIIVNRRIATAARLAVRGTYTQEEFSEFAVYKPNFFNSRNFVQGTIEIGEEKHERLIPQAIALSEPVIGMSVVLKDGSARFFA